MVRERQANEGRFEITAVEVGFCGEFVHPNEVEDAITIESEVLCGALCHRVYLMAESFDTGRKFAQERRGRHRSPAGQPLEARTKCDGVRNVREERCDAGRAPSVQFVPEVYESRCGTQVESGDASSFEQLRECVGTGAIEVLERCDTGSIERSIGEGCSGWIEAIAEERRGQEPTLDPVGGGDVDPGFGGEPPTELFDDPAGEFGFVTMGHRAIVPRRRGPRMPRSRGT